MQPGNVGLALGGGGVKGLAHIPLLKVLDEFNITPTKIVGTSMGAIVGALYASGLSGKDIESRVRDHIVTSEDKAKVWIKKRKQLIKWAKVFKVERNRGGFITADGLFEHLFSEINDIDFQSLKIPFSAITTDFHTAEEVAIHSGEVLSAVRASMAVPGIFAPVERDGRLLIDGGTINNLPCDKIYDNTDYRIASDVISLSPHSNPRTTQVIAGALNIMLTQQTKQSLEKYPPHLLFQPDTTGIDAFDFFKINQALERGEKAAEELRNRWS